MPSAIAEPYYRSFSMAEPSAPLDLTALRRRFDAAAETFDDADFVHAATREGLLARLAPMLVDARLVLDLGAATGASLVPLGKRFPKASVVAIDVSRPMLEKCRARRRWPRRPATVQADARALPFADASVDLVFANLLLPWVGDPASLASEVSRVLRKDGLFVFSSLGPDSFASLREAGLLSGARVPEFPDMHDVGDALVRAGLRDPVLDVDRLAVSYETPARLLADLKAVGAAPGNGEISLQDPLAKEQRIHVELELVYGHAWGSGRGRDDGSVRIDAGTIAIRKREL